MKPWLDVLSFQARIDIRVPPSKDNKSVVRLVWGQDIEDTAFGATTPRYWTRRRKMQDGSYQYWKVPRWILERRMEPEQYAAAWQQSRYSMHDADGNMVDKGDPPVGGYYMFAYLIADHEALDASGWPACCTRAYYEDRKRCWGKYCHPGDFHLQLISQAMRQMEADKFRDPYRPLTPSELAEIEAMAGMQVERNAEQMLNMEREMAADFYGVPLSTIPENYGRRDSGLIVSSS